MSHQPALVSSNTPIASACSAQQNGPKGDRMDCSTRKATRCAPELPATSRLGPERNVRRSVGAPGVPAGTSDTVSNATTSPSTSTHRSLQEPQPRQEPGVNPKRLAVARWSLVAVRLVQILVCAFCAWSTATSAMAIDNIRTQSQAADLLYTLLLVFAALCSSAGAVDLLWLLLVIKPGWRRQNTACCGGKPYSCELTCDVTNIGVWFALLLSILVQKLWDQWRGIAGTLVLAALHGVSAGLVVWRRLQGGPAAAAGDGGAAQPSGTYSHPQRLMLQPIPYKPKSGRGPMPSTDPPGTRASQYTVPVRS